MRTPLVLFLLLLGPATAPVTPATAEETPPAEGPAAVVARVNGDPILLQEVLQVLAEMAMEAETAGGGAMAHGDPGEILDRLITARLVTQEARNIGLEELPEVRRPLESYRVLVLRNLLFADRLKAIVEPAEEGVRREYLDAVTEVRMRALLFESEDAARRLEEALARGEDFDRLADASVASGEATEGDSRSFMRAGGLFPEVREALARLEPGEISSLIETGGQWVILRLLERRVPEDPEERAKARSAALLEERQLAVRLYADELKERYVRIRAEVLESLDFASQEPGIESYMDDERVIAEVEGGEPVTVGELAAAVQSKFFHGPEHAARAGRLDEKTERTFQELLDKRVILREATALGLDETESYRTSMTGYEDSLLFGLFVRKVLESGLTVEDEELRAYLEAHAREYSSPAMVRLESAVFAGEAAGRAALEKLERGSEFGWVRSNAPDQLSPGEDDSLLVFRGAPLMVSTLPGEVRRAIEGAESGEYRTLHDPSGPFYVLLVREMIPSRPRPLEEVREDVAARLYGEKRQRALDEYAAKLREYSEVEVLLGGEDLRAAVLTEISKPE
jgi:hypothetical protein